MALLAACVFFFGNAIALVQYEYGYNFCMMSIPILLVAIWFELRKED